VNAEERNLADALHRITPEPPRPVTVEQVAYRLVSEPRLGRQTRGRKSRRRRGGLGVAFAPALAAAAVVVIVGASAGIAVLANSHHNSPPRAGGAPASSTSVSSSPASPAQTSSPTQQTTPTRGIAGLPWGAALIDHQSFFPDSLISADGSLYAFGNGTLERIDPATGAVVDTAQFSPAILNPPVVAGNTVWVVTSYSGGNIVLQGYDASTLARTSSVQVPAIGGVSNQAQGVLAAGPDGNLYVAAGDTIALVNPASGQVSQLIYMTAGQANSVAVSPDGSKLYVGIGPTRFRLLVYDLPGHVLAGSSALTDGGYAGNLVATSGGVWGTTGSGHLEWAWFAPGGDLTRAVRVGEGAGGGFSAYPSYSGGAVWVGGDGDLVCASPVTGQVRASAAIPGDRGVAQFLASPVVSGGRTYSSYQTDASQTSGLVRLTPPAACTGGGS
jgi:hypothetical protein